MLHIVKSKEKWQNSFKFKVILVSYPFIFKGENACLVSFRDIVKSHLGIPSLLEVFEQW